MLLRFEQVSFSYPGSERILKNLSFDIEKGERVGLIGANGAGKSTLMKAALGLIEAEGDISVDGLPMNRQNLQAIRRKVGYVLQDSENQMFMPTVLEDMVFGPMNYGLSRKEAEAKSDEVLEALALSYLKTRRNHTLSGGEKKMAAIAVILAMEPSLILMDEPSSSLDPRNRRRVINLLNERPETLLIASHDLDFILDTCRRVIVIDDGTLVADGPAEEILGNKGLMESHGLELPFSMARR